MTQTSIDTLEELETFAKSMTTALNSVFSRSDAGAVLAVVEAALPIGTRAEIGRLLAEAERLHLPRPAVRRQLLQRASTTLDRVLACDGVQFSRYTANSRASRPEIKSLAERLKVSAGLPR